jgi:hypothetical protein
MEIEGQKLKKHSDNYFNLIVFLFRTAGFPFKMNTISAIYAVYMITVIFCTCCTFIGMAANVYVHRDDLEHITPSLRVLMPLMNVMITYVYCR